MPEASHELVSLNYNVGTDRIRLYGFDDDSINEGDTETALPANNDPASADIDRLMNVLESNCEENNDSQQGAEPTTSVPNQGNIIQTQAKKKVVFSKQIFQEKEEEMAKKV